MSQAACPKCEQPYSLDNPPKRLINCAHTLCLACLHQEIRNSRPTQSAPSTANASSVASTPSRPSRTTSNSSPPSPLPPPPLPLSSPPGPRARALPLGRAGTRRVSRGAVSRRRREWRCPRCPRWRSSSLPPCECPPKQPAPPPTSPARRPPRRGWPSTPACCTRSVRTWCACRTGA